MKNVRAAIAEGTSWQKELFKTLCSIEQASGEWTIARHAVVQPRTLRENASHFNYM